MTIGVAVGAVPGQAYTGSQAGKEATRGYQRP